MRYFLPIVFMIAVIQIAQTRSISDLILASSGTPVKVILSNMYDSDDDDIILLVETDENNETLEIELPNNLTLEEGIRIQIIDVNGIVLEDTRVENYHQNIDISDLQLGVYFLRLQSPKMQSQQTFNITASNNIRFQ